jgi:heterotetrameric sarcosine oxidase gamma subunit
MAAAVAAARSGAQVMLVEEEQYLGGHLRWSGPAALDHLPLTLIDLTHARVLLRLAGANSAMLLSKICAINFAAAAFPNGRAVSRSVAEVPSEIVRDDLLASGDTISPSGGNTS